MLKVLSFRADVHCLKPKKKENVRSHSMGEQDRKKYIDYYSKVEEYCLSQCSQEAEKQYAGSMNDLAQTSLLQSEAGSHAADKNSSTPSSMHKSKVSSEEKYTQLNLDNPKPVILAVRNKSPKQ